ncbi:predicted protein [Sclerotinia sclerotiorum 1980 UF-70]|uniref:Uncharacterized protein n=1 Tax=Sclerotinia sclerotiorum (strain ATCC 18683 / 1980 / Ss-1) TaxID=665079 RepID=A7ENI9_SCLS1|nr:predicted protein [Sclerotinia sclerotiorum 1980 UF-70]EDO04405.1 predicted protein [Sclerotinia sclerotiorum 1980 UF-70]
MSSIHQKYASLKELAVLNLGEEEDNVPYFKSQRTNPVSHILSFQTSRNMNSDPKLCLA